MNKKKEQRISIRKPSAIARAYAQNVVHSTALPTPISKRIDSGTGKDAGKHIDGWQNLITGLGTTSDKRLSTGFSPDPRLTYVDLTYLYRSDGLAKRVIDLPVNDMFRAWFKIEGDPEGEMEVELNRLDAKKMIKRAVRLARLFGGSLAILGIDDGQEYDKPVNEKRIQGIDHIHVFDRWRMTVNTADLYIDPANEKYGMPERYLITPLYGSPFYVHESRVLRFEGADVTDLIRIQNLGWGDSVLQACWDRIRALGESYGNLETILGEYVLGVMTITNLQEMLANGKEALARKRINYVDMTKHIMNTVLLDKEEEYTRNTITATGIGDMMDKVIEALSAVTGIPVCLLMGRSQAGLSDSEASQVRFYYDMISGLQEEEITPQVTRLIHYLNLSIGNPLADEWFIRYNPLWQPTEAQIVKQRLDQATTDNIYLTQGVLTPHEVAVSRFGGDHYSHDSNLSESHKLVLGLEVDEDKLAEEEAGEASQVIDPEEQARQNATKEPNAAIAAWEEEQQSGTMFGKNPPSQQPQDTKKRADASDGIDLEKQGLTTLEGKNLPEELTGWLRVSGNKLKNLKGCPKVVNGALIANHNPLESLEGAPRSVEDLHCNSSGLKSLVGAPRECFDFHVHNNDLTSCEGAPDIIRKDFHAYFNKLTTLKGLPEEVGGDVFVSDNQLTSLKGLPRKIGGDVDLRNNPTKFTEEQVRAASKVEGEVRV